MKAYGVNELRRMFLDFFESKGHLKMKSFSVILSDYLILYYYNIYCLIFCRIIFLLNPNIKQNNSPLKILQRKKR